MENSSPFIIAIGLVFSWACLAYSNKFIPFKKIDRVNFLKLITYPFYLIGQIYSAGFYVIKIIFTGERVDIVEIKTKLQSESLRVLLADSITLTPGSILLDLKDDKLTLVWLRPKTDPDPKDTTNADEQLKNKLENQILKAEVNAAIEQAAG